MNDHPRDWTGYTAFLAASAGALLVTGCPHNEYIVELTPRGPAMERKLVFYRVDGQNSRGLPNYQTFPSNELTLITRAYPPGGLSWDGQRQIAAGKFANAMPADIGGAGSYLNLTTSLGSAAFYVERFRGDDDVAARIEKRSKAADQLTDLLIGWSQKELGRERNYKRLRRFLDTDLRRDLKNLSFYAWMLQNSAAAPKPEVEQEFVVRFGQYLAERGYLKMEDLPDLFRIGSDSSTERLVSLVRRLVTVKLGVPNSNPLPRGLAILSDADTVWNSWREYLRTTALYRARLREWQRKKLFWGAEAVQRQVTGFLFPWGPTNRPSLSPGPSKPDPDEVAAELTADLLELQFWNTVDHVTVRLFLSSAPTDSNGKWDESHKQVSWESDLQEQTNSVRLPMVCYASWSEPNDTFQQEHFGKVALRGEDLTKYCLWRGSLDEKQANEWDALLLNLKPGEALTNRLEAFRFSGEPGFTQGRAAPSLADLPRGWIRDGLR